MHHSSPVRWCVGVQDAVHDRVAQVQVRARHVDLRAQRPRAVGEFAGAHPREEVQVLLHGAVAVRAVLARPRQRAAMRADLVGGQVADVRLALADQLDGPLVHLLEIVRGEEQPVAPVRADPAHVLDDGVHELLLFLGRVGVVEPQIEQPAEILRDAEIDPERLRVADMQIGVRLRREARVDAVEAPGAQVLLHRLADKIRGRSGRRAAFVTLLRLHGFVLTCFRNDSYDKAVSTRVSRGSYDTLGSFFQIAQCAST